MKPNDAEAEKRIDLALIERYVQNDDLEALDQLVKRHGRAVYSFIYRFLGADPHIDDVYQDVWMRVLKSVARFGGRSRFTTWLFQITRNICIDHLRRRKRQGPTLSLDDASLGRSEDEGLFRDTITAKGPSVEEVVSRRELRRHLEDAIAQLPPDQREVFLLREKTDMTFEEISEMSGVPRNTIKSRMRYALENIRRYMKRRRSGSKVTNHGERS